MDMRETKGVTGIEGIKADTSWAAKGILLSKSAILAMLFSFRASSALV